MRIQSQEFEQTTFEFSKTATFCPDLRQGQTMAQFDETNSRVKRRKIDDVSTAVSEPSLAITTHKQLQALLAFQQSVSQDVKRGEKVQQLRYSNWHV